ncbi:capsule biosynthesis protein [Flexibacterium corallicola]|uniref:capsule biosynthesis protein n=1 Tax=Flexibacterium corallicola TaxID=3037259 RepID=UPI00286F7E69|nr:capsular biosynthesis protein [Pseudovibrio sp. M1P-2-3]
MSKRSVLFLQSHPSGFGSRLADEFRSEGADCHIINLSLSDWFFRVGQSTHNYWGRLKSWRGYLERFVKKHGITDIVYYADRRPYHRVAHSVAMELGLNVFAYEFGYLRPHWITLETGGMGVYSHFPNDPREIRELAANLPDEDLREMSYPHPFTQEALSEVLCNLGPVFFPYCFPFYNRDRYYHPLRDYLSYIPRLLRQKRVNTQAQQLVEDLVASETPFFLVPLQMQSDYQIRHHSPYTHISEMIEEVIGSFAKHADAADQLVFKLHPFDNNIEKWPYRVEQIAKKHGLSERVKCIDGGDLELMLRTTKGCVLINSTTGLAALEANVPTKVLGIALYDIEGLTDQRPLDSFWQLPQVPDQGLFADLKKLLAASIQIRGSFYNKEGREVAVKEFVGRVLGGTVNGFGAYKPIPPRLQKARDVGIQIPENCYWSEAA